MSAQTTHRFANAYLPTGVRLRYAAQGETRGRPVIMLHGYTDSWFSFSRVLPLLDPSLRVFALDQRGHGDSERPADGYSLADLSADVVSFMDAHGLEDVVLVGHCMGSHVAQRVALAAPARVGALVLVSSSTTLRNDAVVEFGRAVSRLADPVPAEFVREFQESTVALPVPAGFMDRVVAESLKLPARVWRALLEGMLAEPDPVALGSITAPTLVICGERDELFPRAEQELLASRIPGAAFRLYEGVGHSPQWERPGEFARDLAEFVAAEAAEKGAPHASPEPCALAL